MGSTNYYDTFIEVAPDCPVDHAAEPRPRGTAPTVAELQYRMIAEHPYEYDSDDVLFTVFADRAGIGAEDRAAEREAFFAKGQPCLRASALGKRLGWGVHSDDAGRVALHPVESDRYRELAADPGVAHLVAMRSKRA